MDGSMPEMDGYEATKTIHASGNMLPITAHAMQGDRKEFIDAGMDDYIPKTVNAKVLEKTIQKVLREA